MWEDNWSQPRGKVNLSNLQKWGNDIGRSTSASKPCKAQLDNSIVSDPSRQNEPGMVNKCFAVRESVPFNIANTKTVELVGESAGQKNFA